MITAAAQRKRPTGGVCNDLLLCIFTISGWKACEADSPHCFFPRFSIPKAQDLRKATRSAVPRTCYNHIHADREKNKNNKTDLAWLGSKKKASNVCLVSQDTFWPSWKQNKRRWYYMWRIWTFIHRSVREENNGLMCKDKVVERKE